MTHRSYVAIALLLSACGSADAPATDQQAAVAKDVVTVAPTVAASQAAPTPPAANPPPDWAGRYSATTDGGIGEAVITRAGQTDRYRVAIEIANDTGCGGAVSGDATATGNRLTMVAPIEDMPGESCRITFTRDGAIMRGATEGNCSYFSGMSCGFDAGVYRRIASAGGR